MNQHAISVEFDEEKIDAIFASVNQCELPGAAVGIAIRGTPVYRKAFGLAHMELPIFLSPSMRMRIYSTSKHFTCLSYMLLCEEGRAGVDDPIGKYFPELRAVAPGVTVRHLMGNIGGMRNPMNLRWEFGSGEREIPIEELLDVYRDIDDVNFTPGSAFNYNNSGFELVAMAVERITGQRFEDVLRTRIFEPVCMNNTLLRRLNSDFVPNSATMHMMDSVGRFEKTCAPGVMAGSGGIVSSVDDMLRWLRHMDTPLVGSADTWTMMKTSQVLSNRSATGYGFGLCSGIHRGVQMLHHSGGGMGANSQMLKVPAVSLDIVVMVNRGDLSAGELTEQILDACLPGLAPPVTPTVDREIPTGVFRSITSPLVIQLSRMATDHAFVKAGEPLIAINGAEMRVALDATGVLRPAAAGGVTRFAVEIVGELSNPCALKFNTDGSVQTLKPVERAESAEGSQIVGRYVCKALSTKAEISRCGDEVRLAFRGRMGTIQCKLEGLAHGIWVSTQICSSPRKSVLCFEGGAGAFDYLSYSTHNTPLRFEPISKDL